MADQKIVEKLKEIIKDPEAIKRLEQAQKTARETIEYIRKASRPPANWREQRFTI
jgi:hypothetical protein